MQFGLTRRVCDEVGREYEVFTGLERVAHQNLRWLAGYRQDRCAPTPDTVGAITDCFADPVPLRVGMDRVSRSTGQPSDAALANILHLLWRRELSTNLSRPLSLAAEVWA